jgi:hypothetical protein
MPAGFGETTISLAEPAYVGMPVWLNVERRQGLGHILYPSLLGPAGFGCDQVEVRRDGKLLPQLPGSNWMKYAMVYSEKGPSEELVRFLLRQTEYGAAHRDEIVAASLPYLDSDSAVAVGGVLTALRWPPGTISPATFEALLRSAEHILQRADAQTRADLLQSLAGLPSGKGGDPRVHVLLQKFVDQGFDEAAQPLTTFRDPADLSRLAALFSRPGREISPVFPQEMYAAYGQASVPYLKDELRTSASRFTAGDLARELMAIGEPEGFRYALGQLNIQGGLRTAMIQSLKSQFPELRDSSDDAIVSFVKSRVGN